VGARLVGARFTVARLATRHYSAGAWSEGEPELQFKPSVGGILRKAFSIKCSGGLIRLSKQRRRNGAHDGAVLPAET
jgi:hypothetical protein